MNKNLKIGLISDIHEDIKTFRKVFEIHSKFRYRYWSIFGR